MKIASFGRIPSKYWNHDTSLKNDKNKTVAIILA